MLNDLTPKELRCSLGACPAVYSLPDDDSIVVIGAEISDAVADELRGKIGAGERAVRLPSSFFSNVPTFNREQSPSDPDNTADSL